jgi:hypothetical protein
LAKSRRSKKSVNNKSIKQSRKSARGLVGNKKGQDRRAPARRRRLGGGGPNPHPPDKPTPTTITPEPQQPAPGSPEERNLREIVAAHSSPTN